MNRIVPAAGSLLLTVAAFAVASVNAQDSGKSPTIKDVMSKLHKGANSPLAKLKGELKGDSPNWGDVQNLTKDFVTLGKELEKNDPPKGDKESFKVLANRYYADVKVLDDAAQRKDTEAARAAHQRLSTSCKACHTAHKS